MIDPIQPVAFTPAPAVRDVAPAASAAGDQPGDGSGAGQNAPLPAAKPQAVSLSVDRDDMGVFVYTLTDSASGRVIAVIPRSAVVSSPQSGEAVDMEA